MKKSSKSMSNPGQALHGDGNSSLSSERRLELEFSTRETRSRSKRIGAKVTVMTRRNNYKLPVELNTYILLEAVGSSLHEYFITQRCVESGTATEQQQDEWARNSFFVLSSVSHSFREIMKKTIMSLFNIDINQPRWVVWFRSTHWNLQSARI